MLGPIGIDGAAAAVESSTGLDKSVSAGQREDLAASNARGGGMRPCAAKSHPQTLETDHIVGAFQSDIRKQDSVAAQTASQAKALTGWLFR